MRLVRADMEQLSLVRRHRVLQDPAPPLIIKCTLPRNPGAELVNPALNPEHSPRRAHDGVRHQISMYVLELLGSYTPWMLRERGDELEDPRVLLRHALACGCPLREVSVEARVDWDAGAAVEELEYAPVRVSFTADVGNRALRHC